MKIAILNNCFFNENHLNKLKTLGEVVTYENTNTEQLAIERIKNSFYIQDKEITWMKKEDRTTK